MSSPRPFGPFEKFALALTLLLFSRETLAFPLPETVGLLSQAGAGMIALGGLALNTLRKSLGAKITALAVLALTAWWGTGILSEAPPEEMKIQSIAWPENVRLKESEAARAFLSEGDFSLSAWKGRTAKLKEAVSMISEGASFIDVGASLRADRPYVSRVIGERFEFHQVELIAESLRQNQNSQALIFAQEDQKSVYAAKKLKERGLDPVILPFSEIQKKIRPRKIPSSAFFKASGESFFERDLIDIRPAAALQRFKPFANSRRLSIVDMWLMSDKELERFLGKTKKSPLIVWSSPYFAELAYERLRSLSLKTRFLEGGVFDFFRNGEAGRRNSITPYYFNRERLIGLEEARRLMSEAGDIRFVCFKNKSCHESVPIDKRVEVQAIGPFTDIGSLKGKISSLDKKQRRVILANDQDTYGSALLLGYWMDAAGIPYLGVLTAYKELAASGGFDQKGNIDAGVLGFARKGIKKIHGMSREGGLNGFLVLGALLGLVRVLFFAARRRSVYRHSAALAQAATVILLAFGFYFLLYQGLRNLEFLSGSELTLLEQNLQAKTVWSGALCGLIALSLLIALPAPGALVFFGVLAAGLVLFFSDYLRLVYVPILQAAAASEAVFILFSLPGFVSKVRSKRLKENGIFLQACVDKERHPEKWTLAADFKESAPGVLVAANADLQRLKKLNLWEEMIVRSCVASKEESVLSGLNKSLLTGRDSLAETINAVLKAQNAPRELSYVLIQPFTRFEASGVAASLDPRAQGVLLEWGAEHSDAVDGRRGTKRQVVSRNGRVKHPAVRLLLKVEKRLRSPVVIEWGLAKGKVHLLQVRRASYKTNPALKFWPGDIGGFKLAESFMARPSRFAGSLFERATDGDYLWHQGFLYERVKRRPSFSPFPRKSLDECVFKLKQLEQELPFARGSDTARILEELAQIYAKAYRLYKCPLSFNLEPLKELPIVLSLRGQDMDPLSEFETRPANSSFHSGKRESFHALFAYISRLVGQAASKSLRNVKTSRALKDTSFGELVLAFKLDETSAALRAEEELFPVQRDGERFIVPGALQGIIWRASEGPPPEDGKRYILAAEEIPSSWVRHLRLFSGVMSIYGGELSHVAQSCAYLGIPYQIVGELPEHGQTCEQSRGLS